LLLRLAVVATLALSVAATARSGTGFASHTTAHATAPSPLTPAQAKRAVSRGAMAGQARRAAAALPAGGFGNGIFQVYVTGSGGTGAGQFTVLTGEQNPAGAGHDVLFGQGVPGTSYLVLRDLTTGVDYVQGPLLTHANEISLDNLGNVQRVSDTASTTQWFASSFTLHQGIEVTGSTAADTRVVVTAEVTDHNTPAHRYRIRYLWDTAIGTDDGPVIQPRTANTAYRPFEPTIGMEQTIGGAGDLVAVDNDGNSAPPTLAVALSGTDNPTAVPDSVKYLCWQDAVFASFGVYVTDATRNVSGTPSDCLNSQGQADAAVEYLWSQGAGTGPLAVAASLRMSPPSPYATTMKAGPLSLGSATATLTDTATGRPIAGRTVRFGSGASTFCVVVTDAAGRAACNGLLVGLLGYDVSYPGGAIWAPSTAHGGLL
jgi:hypothetical protein